MDEPPPAQVLPDLAALYVRHRHVLWRVTQRQLPIHMHDRAGDVINDVFAKLQVNPPTEPIENWEAYLITLVRRRAISVCRQEHVDRYGEFPAEDGAVFGVWDGASERASDQAVKEILMRLEPRRRRILEQVVIADRPAKAVAAEMGISEGRVSQLKSDALQRFKTIWEQQTGEAS